jgi:hypothetical protein
MKTLITALAVAAILATAAVAKSRTQPHHTAPTQVHRSSTGVTGVRDYVTGEILGTDPDPRVRYELRRDGSSSWEEPLE